MSRCAQCHDPTDVSLCVNCATALRIQLGDVAPLLADLDITRSRQDQLTDPRRETRGGGETPLPYKPHIGEVIWVLHDTLAAWVTTLGGDTRNVNTAALAKYLLRNIHHIRHLSVDAGQLADEVTAAIRYARNAIDRPDDQRLILGPCGAELPDRTSCRHTVYGVAWREHAVCDFCGACHNIAARQQWLLDLVQDHLGTAIEIAGFLRVQGMRCTPSAIRNLAARKRLAPEPDTHPPLYHIRDVLAALKDRVPQKKRAG